MRRRIPIFTAVSGVVLLSGCVYALNTTNTPSTEKIKVVAASENHYAIRIEGHGETAVSPNGRIDLSVPSLPRGCSVYVFGLIKIREGSPEYIPAIQVLRNGKVVLKLSLHSLHKLPTDGDGYRVVRL